MLEPGCAPLGIPLDLRRILDLQLPCQVVQHFDRHIQRIGEECPQIPDRRQLQRESQPVVITATTTDQRPVFVVKEEELLQFDLRRNTVEPAERGRRGITEELNRHAPAK